MLRSWTRSAREINLNFGKRITNYHNQSIPTNRLPNPSSSVIPAQLNRQQHRKMASSSESATKVDGKSVPAQATSTEATKPESSMTEIEGEKEKEIPGQQKSDPNTKSGGESFIMNAFLSSKRLLALCERAFQLVAVRLLILIPDFTTALHSQKGSQTTRNARQESFESESCTCCFIWRSRGWSKEEGETEEGEGGGGGLCQCYQEGG